MQVVSLMRRVIIPINADPGNPRPSGTVRYSLHIAQELRRRGHPVKLLTAGPGPLLAGFEVQQVAARPTREALFVLKLFRHAASIGANPSDVILANGEHYAFPFALERRLRNLILVAHGPIASALSRRRPVAGLLYHLIERRVVSRCPVVVAVDRQAEAYYSRNYPGTRVVRMGVPVDMRLFQVSDQLVARRLLRLPAAGKQILVAARPAKEKNLELAARAFVYAAKRRDDLHFVYTGGRPTEAFTSDVMASFPPGKFHPLGALPPDKMPMACQAADVLLITSLEEQLPTVALEAMACGIPVVATPVGDLPDLLSQPSLGRCVPASERDLACGILDVLELSQADSEELRRTRRTAVAAFSLDRVGEALSEICETL